ncbi:hypothetical protein C8R46DRAFT_1029331 [Mycena filopes]|nr:hypothetical protein C8R46DRAFT_1029331 [Mycena filopes]
MAQAQKRQKKSTIRFNYLHQTVAATLSISRQVPADAIITLADVVREVRRNGVIAGIEIGPKMVSSVTDRLSTLVGNAYGDERARVLASFPVIKLALDSMTAAAVTGSVSSPRSAWHLEVLSPSAAAQLTHDQQLEVVATGDAEATATVQQSDEDLVHKPADYQPIPYEGDAQVYEQQIFARIEAWQMRNDNLAARSQRRMEMFLRESLGIEGTWVKGHEIHKFQGKPACAAEPTIRCTRTRLILPVEEKARASGGHSAGTRHYAALLIMKYPGAGSAIHPPFMG